MAETVWARGTGGSLFELDLTPAVEKKLESGELVLCDAPKKKTAAQRARREAEEAKAAEEADGGNEEVTTDGTD